MTNKTETNSIVLKHAWKLGISIAICVGILAWEYRIQKVSQFIPINAVHLVLMRNWKGIFSYLSQKPFNCELFPGSWQELETPNFELNATLVDKKCEIEPLNYENQNQLAMLEIIRGAKTEGFNLLRRSYFLNTKPPRNYNLALALFLWNKYSASHEEQDKLIAVQAGMMLWYLDRNFKEDIESILSNLNESNHKKLMQISLYVLENNWFEAKSRFSQIDIKTLDPNGNIG